MVNNRVLLSVAQRLETGGNVFENCNIMSRLNPHKNHNIIETTCCGFIGG